MEKEKFDAVINYFTSIGITLPTEVRNAIEDVFMENDTVDEVQCYHVEDAEQFQKDLTLYNDVRMSISGSNSGKTNNVWTYYGDVTFSLSEKITLFDDDGQPLEEISNIENHVPTLLENPADYAVILYEIVEWESGEEKKFSRTTNLYIYCPKTDDVDTNMKDDRYEGIYNRITSEVENGKTL